MEREVAELLLSGLDNKKVAEDANSQKPVAERAISPCILRFMARSTMQAMLKGDPEVFGPNPEGRSAEEIARDMYEKVQKEKKSYEKLIRKEMIMLALGKGTDEWMMACFRALRRNAKEPWLPEPTDYTGSSVNPEEVAKKKKDLFQELDKEAVADAGLIKRREARTRQAGGNRLLAALEEQMKAERDKEVQEGSREAELQAEMLKLYENQTEGADLNGNEAKKEDEANKQLQKMRRELRELRREAERKRKEEEEKQKKEQKEKDALLNERRAQHEFLRKQKKQQMALRAKGIFEDGLPDVKNLADLRQRANCPTLEFACVEPNPEERVTLTELPLERSLGRPAVVWKRPQSGFAKFYARAGPRKAQAMLPSCLRPQSP